MMFPLVTATYAAILGLILAALSLWVVAGRLSSGVLHGDGGREAFGRRMRAHANFTEYVPLILILIALLEMMRTSIYLITPLLIILVIARLMHPFGMLAPVNSMQQYIFRGLPAVATLAVLIIAAATLLLRCLSVP